MRTTDDSRRRWRVVRLGTPRQALRLDTAPVRRPGPGQVRIEVEAIGLNHPDLLLCAGRYQERPEPPFTPGYEAAGRVADPGPDSGLAIGQRVVVVPELPEGALQESLTVPLAQVYPVPESIPASTAAVLHIAYTTAHVALHRRARIRPGETLLVTGAAGGVGSAALQLGRAAGARVVALAAGPAKAEACGGFGADVVLDPGADDLVARVRAAVGGRGADVVLDVVGGALFDTLRHCVAFEGRLLSVGFTSSGLPRAPVNHVLLRNYAVVGLHLALYRREAPELLREVHRELVELATAGVVAPRITELDFEEAPAALELLAGRGVIGRVVLTRGR